MIVAIHERSLGHRLICSFVDGPFGLLGYMLHFMRDQARKIMKNYGTNPLARIIRHESFYWEFVAQRLMWRCLKLGLDLPPIIQALGTTVTDEGQSLGYLCIMC